MSADDQAGGAGDGLTLDEELLLWLGEEPAENWQILVSETLVPSFRLLSSRFCTERSKLLRHSARTRSRAAFPWRSVAEKAQARKKFHAVREISDSTRWESLGR